MNNVSKSLTLILILIIAISSLSLIIVKPANAQPTVHDVSQTFELNQGVDSGVADFDLQIGDHIEGSFSVSNLGPYPLGPLGLALNHSGTSYEVVEVSVIPPEPNGHPPNENAILDFSFTPTQNSFNFNFTANQQGVYQMWASSGAMDYLQNAKNPVMALNYEWTGTPMKTNILSPFSQIYEESNISLTFTVNRAIDWAGYSLNGDKNVTLWDSDNGNPETANTTLTGLATGVHSLTIYANDSWGNMNSKTVTFTVEKPEIGIFENTVAVIVTVVIAIIILIVGLLLFRRHRKNINLNQTFSNDVVYRLSSHFLENC